VQAAPGYCQGVRAWPATQPPRLPGRGEPLRLYDSSSGEIRPAASGPLARMYVCGITPYDATHLGHALTYVNFDLVQRTLLDAGVEVSYVQNVTDVDEPLLERAERDGIDWRDLALAETERFRQDMTALRVIAPQAYIGAVEAIPLIIPVIEKLLADGNAYLLDGDIYFAVDTAAHFGSVAGLSRTQMLQLFAERGGDPDRPGKHDPLDPVLWRGPRPGEPSWEAPFGPGRPGWHVECAAIALEHLGSQIDIQGGGSDLAYPHHECSAAHAGAFSGRWPFADSYVHSGMLAFKGTKMSKSLGNLVFVSALRRDGVDPMAIRLSLLSHHYRSDWEWTAEVLDEGIARLERWRAAVALEGGPDAANVLARVRACLANDLDAPAALAALDGWANGALAGDSSDPEAPALVRVAVDALLGIEL
jgi:L-cysteine:1D-myo-inositol 2-amino-2-deoxy-alpha-D-glucopyranoside ligase